MSSEKSFSQSSLEFLVENAIYPMWSKKGEVYFRAKKGVLTPEKKRELVEELNLRTKEDWDGSLGLDQKMMELVEKIEQWNN